MLTLNFWPTWELLIPTADSMCKYLVGPINYHVRFCVRHLASLKCLELDSPPPLMVSGYRRRELMAEVFHGSKMRVLKVTR